MKQFLVKGWRPVDAEAKEGQETLTLWNKLWLGLTFRQYLSQAVRNPFNWVIAIIFAIGIPLVLYRFVFGLGAVTHSSNDYPWGLFLSFGLFAMVPLSASGFMLGTAVEIFGRHDFEPVERLAMLNGLLGYFFAVVFLLVDLGQPWRLPYPMAVAFGPAAVLFLVGWHVATYLTVQVAEVSVSFFEWMNWPVCKKFIRRITIGLTVSGIILSTLHQGALGALFTYAPGKLHPLWYSASFQWLHFLVSAIPGGLCMVIVVSTIVKKTMAWRCDERFMANLDRLTIALAKGASMGLITYLVIKLIGVAHDNEWIYLSTGWGSWYLFEMGIGVVLPLILFARGIRYNKVGLIRFTALLTVFGVVLNRLNTALIAFNWKLYQDIPHWKEITISITLFTLYIVTYRFILYRLPILFEWKTQPAEAPEAVRAKTVCPTQSNPSPAGAVYRSRD
jgi:Ni/Fe-hydrogenase subunit HybB-like protein